MSIRITQCDDEVKIVVEDDGVGMDEEKLHSLLDAEMPKSDVGLLNIDLRLKRLIGNGLEIRSEKEVGTIVSFTIPVDGEQK